MKWFRPGIVVALVVGVIAGFLLKMLDAVAFFGFATGLVVWWFRSRDEAKRNGE